MGVINNLNYIISAAVYPCADPGPIILIETAFEAAAPVLLELASWSCIDILKLRAGISYRCGKQLKAIIKAAHGAEVLDRTHFLYSFVAPVETALWYWFVADLTSEFLANWTSLVYQQGHCIPGRGECTYSADSLSQNLIPAKTSFGIVYEATGNPCYHMYYATYGFTVPNDWYFDTFFTATTKPFTPGDGGNFSLYLHRVEPSPFDYEKKEFSPPLLGGNAKGHYRISGRAAPDARLNYYQYRIETDSLQWLIDGRMVTHISPLPILDDPSIGVGCFKKDWRPPVFPT